MFLFFNVIELYRQSHGFWCNHSFVSLTSVFHKANHLYLFLLTQAIQCCISGLEKGHDEWAPEHLQAMAQCITNEDTFLAKVVASKNMRNSIELFYNGMILFF